MPKHCHGCFQPQTLRNSHCRPKNGLNLHDVYKRFHSDIDFNMHKDRTKHVNYILSTLRIIHSTQRIAYKRNHNLPKTKHRGMFIDIQTNVFKNTITPF